jgi:hypothetical protein
MDSSASSRLEVVVEEAIGMVRPCHQ